MISSVEFDSIVSVDDLCMAAGLVCTSQKKALRHYNLGNDQELTVNTARNEWAMTAVLLSSPLHSDLQAIATSQRLSRW